MRTPTRLLVAVVAVTALAAPTAAATPTPAPDAATAVTAAPAGIDRWARRAAHTYWQSLRPVSRRINCRQYDRRPAKYGRLFRTGARLNLNRPDARELWRAWRRILNRRCPS